MRQQVTKIDRQGRIVLPAEFRRALGLKSGDKVTLSLEDCEIRVVSLSAAIRRAQDLVSRTSAGRSLVDELIAERRAEAARD